MPGPYHLGRHRSARCRKAAAQGVKKRGLIKSKRWLLLSRWKNLASQQRGELNRQAALAVSFRPPLWAWSYVLTCDAAFWKALRLLRAIYNSRGVKAMKGLRRLCAFVAMSLGLRCPLSAQDPKNPIELSAAVISAAGHNDRPRLDALLISETEFLRFVAPKLKMRNRLVPEFASLKKASDEALDLLLVQMGGQDWKILRIAILTITISASSTS
jgi:hypothetical protein